MEEKTYDTGYDIAFECDKCNLVIHVHSELTIFGNWKDGTFEVEGVCPACGGGSFIGTVSNKYYKPDVGGD